MTSTRILVVDDEKSIVRLLDTSLKLEGYQVDSAGTGEKALALFGENEYELIVLDLGLPDVDGLEILRTIRRTSTVPVMVLTARDDESDKVQGLEAGADDYLTKPFGSPELMARIQALLRRARWAPTGDEALRYEARGIQLDLARRTVTVRGEEVHLTPTEYDILRILIEKPGTVVSHLDLLHQVWDEDYGNDLAILRVNISRLRQKIERDPRNPDLVKTVPGVGYMLPA